MTAAGSTSRSSASRTAMTATRNRSLALPAHGHIRMEMQTFARAAEFSDLSPATNGTLESKLRAMRLHMIDVCDLASLERTETQAHGQPPIKQLQYDHGHK